MKLRNLILATVLSAAIAATGTWFIAQKTITNQKNDLDTCLAKKASLCEGEDLGGLRMNMITCDGEVELCLCGNPNMLKRGLK